MFGSSTTFPIATLKITIKAAPIAVRTRFWSTQRLAMIIIVWRAYYVNPIISSICASPSCIGIGFTWPISTGARSRSLKILYLNCPRIIENCLNLILYWKQFFECLYIITDRFWTAVASHWALFFDGVNLTKDIEQERWFHLTKHIFILTVTYVMK